MINFKIEQNQIKANTPTSLGVMVEIDAPVRVVENVTKREPKGIVFVIDRSGSMGGGRLEIVKSTILDILGQLDADDYLSIVAFDSDVLMLQSMARVGDLDLAATRKAIGEMRTGGNTNLERGFRHGLAEAASAPAGVEVKLVLLSDGQANSGSTDPQLIGQLAAQATEHLISTSTIGIGEGYDEKILVEMSNTGNGNHFAAVNFAESALGLNTEIEGLLARTVSNLRVTASVAGLLEGAAKLRTPNYVHRVQKFDENTQSFHLGALGSGEQRNFVIELAIDPISQTSPAFMNEITVSASYFDEVAQRTVEDMQRFTLTVIDAEHWVEPVRDEDIVMELANVRAQATKEAAMRLAEQGRFDEAREMLERLGMNLDQLAGTMQAMSPRNRARASRHMREIDELSQMDGAMFMKRNAESIKRGYESKPDPRAFDGNNDEEEA